MPNKASWISAAVAAAVGAEIGVDAAAISAAVGHAPMGADITDAAAIGDPELCNYIVQKTGDINPKDKNGITLLHTVAKNGQTEICKILLKYVQDVNPKTFNGRTPLHEAAQNGHLGLCNILINNGADVQTKDNSGFAPLDPISKFMERITYCAVMGLGICWASTLPYSVLHLRKAIWDFATFFD